jgi:DNA polymerase I-like protein with 3'-5' exonuclease and polymerase domains
MTIQYPVVPPLDLSTLNPKLNPTLVVDGAGLDKVGRFLTRVTDYAFDYETNMVEGFYHRRARTLQLGNKDEQYVIDLLAFCETKENLIAAQGLYRRSPAVSDKFLAMLDPVINVVGPSLQSNSHYKLGHNLEFEYVVSKWCLGMRIWNLYCTQISERLIYNGQVPAMQKGFYGMGDLMRRYYKRSIDKALQTSFDLETPLTDEQITYCALDCRLPYAIQKKQIDVAKECGLERVFKIEHDAIPAFGDMYLNGLYVNPEKWKALMDTNQKELDETIDRLDSFFLPIVGFKQPPDHALIERLKAQKEALSLKVEHGEEYESIAAEIRSLGTKKATIDRVNELKARRAQLVEERKSAQAERDVQLKRVSEEWKREARKANKGSMEELATMRGKAAINYASPSQLLDAIHKGPFGLNKTNLKSTNDKMLDKHAEKPVIDAIRTMRSLDKAIGTYGLRWISPNNVKVGEGKKKKFGFVTPETGRIHARFLQLGTDTGRPSATNPNILNLPKDKRYRMCFESRPGYDMVDKDCSGQELRILVQYSREPAWIAAFNKRQDVHSISAEMLNEKAWREAALMVATTVTIDGQQKTLPPCAYYSLDHQKCKCPAHGKERDKMKNINFGVAYDKQAYSTSLELKISKEEAQALLDNWHRTFAQTSKTLKMLRDDAYDNGEARTLSGRRRLITQVTYEQAKTAAMNKHKKNYTQQKAMQMYHSLIAAVKREGGNMAIQGTGADMMKLAMGAGFDPNGKPYLWHTLEPKYGASLLSFIYDELLTESPEEHSEAVSDEVSDAIIRGGGEFVTVIPMESEGAISKYWSK